MSTEQLGRLTVSTSSTHETEALGEQLGQVVQAGDVIALVGALGTGKTVFVRGLARGLAVPDVSVVSSPTFVIVQLYEGGRLPLYHFDAYRLHSAEQLIEIGAEEIFESPAVAVVEWADRVRAALPVDVLWVELRHGGGDRREVRFEARGPRAAALLAAFRKSRR